MKVMTVHALAAAAVANNDRWFVILDIHSDGSSSRFAGAFPSLPRDIIETLGEGPVLLDFDARDEAVSCYNRITRDVAEENQLIGGTVTLVSKDFTSANYEIALDREFPVVTPGPGTSYEVAFVERT